MVTWWPWISTGVGIYLGLAALYWNWRFRRAARSLELAERKAKEQGRVACDLFDELKARERQETHMHIEEEDVRPE